MFNLTALLEKLVTSFLTCTTVNRVTGQELMEVLQIQPSLLQTQPCTKRQPCTLLGARIVIIMWCWKRIPGEKREPEISLMPGLFTK